MQSLTGQSGAVHVRRLSPLAAVALLLLVLVVIGLAIVFAVVAIPLAIIGGLGYAGYRALTAAARRKTNELLNRDEAGRRNVRVFRGGTNGEAVDTTSPSESRSETQA